MRVVFLILISLIPSLAPAQSIGEQALLQLANESRAQYRLPPLTWDAALARAARLHVIRSARAGGIAEHQYPGEPDLLTRAAQAGAKFSTISENVAGNATSAAQIHDAWMHSPAHRSNILDPHVTSVGIAVALSQPRGQSQPMLYAVEDFSRTVDTLGPADVEVRAQQILLGQGIRSDTTVAAKRDARQACTSGTASLTQPSLILQWEGPDLNDLPATVLPQLTNPRKQTVAIGTCATTRAAQGFTTYRIAVLVY
ncbi:hypothetical protein BH10ACI4_BH10ACI4_15260 [soil metagenome]